MKQLLLLPAITAMLLGGAYLMADDEHHKSRNSRQVNTAIAVNQLPASPQQTSYNNECGSCHMAYQPEFLPKNAWRTMMGGLEDHFGVNATLTAQDEQVLSAYLQENAADSKRVGKHFKKMAASAGTDGKVIRISDTRYFKREHKGIPQRFIDQKAVKSIANCNACHQTAAKGDYRERGIFIPNYGPWRD